MNKNEKDFMNELSNLDDFSVEEIAENYPALDENTKKRILKKCMKKDSVSAETDYDDKKNITVSGIERYNRASWYKYASSAAAFILAFVGIASVVIINRNFNGNIDIEKDPPHHATSIYSATVSTSETTVTTSYEPSSEYKTTGENTSVVSNNTTVQSATQAPATSPHTTKTTVTSSVTEPVTSSTQSEPQKTFLNGLYYVGISGIDEYMGFEFMPDGTLTKYFFDETRNAIGSTIVKTNYEIVENQFSFGDKTGTIVNPNDTENFSVQFDDGDIFNFSTQQPILTFRGFYFIETKPDTLSGTIWAKCFGDMDENYNYTDRRTIEFKEDGISGTVYILSHPRNVTKSTITEIPFTYEQNGDEITFYMENSDYTMVKAEIKYSSSLEVYGLNVEYLEADEDGNKLWSFGQTGSLNDYNY